MMMLVRKIWQENKLLLIAFAVACLAMLFFAIRFAIFTAYWSDPAHRQQPLQPWMTIGYVAHSWGVPRDALSKRLGLEPPRTGSPPPLEDLAKRKGVSIEEFEGQIEAVISDLRAEQQK